MSATAAFYTIFQQASSYKNIPVKANCPGWDIFLPFFTGLSVSYTNALTSCTMQSDRGADKFSPV